MVGRVDDPQDAEFVDPFLPGVVLSPGWVMTPAVRAPADDRIIDDLYREGRITATVRDRLDAFYAVHLRSAARKIAGLTD